MQEQGPWDDCPVGVVTDMASRLRRRRRQAQRRPFIFIGAAALLLFALGYGLTNRDDPGSQDKLTCRETVPLLAGFHDQTLDIVSANRVREHLAHCPLCRKHYQELYPGEVRNRSPAEPGLVAITAPFRR